MIDMEVMSIEYGLDLNPQDARKKRLPPSWQQGEEAEQRLKPVGRRCQTREVVTVENRATHIAPAKRVGVEINFQCFQICSRRFVTSCAIERHALPWLDTELASRRRRTIAAAFRPLGVVDVERAFDALQCHAPYADDMPVQCHLPLRTLRHSDTNRQIIVKVERCRLR